MTSAKRAPSYLGNTSNELHWLLPTGMIAEWQLKERPIEMLKMMRITQIEIFDIFDIVPGKRTGDDDVQMSKTWETEFVAPRMTINNRNSHNVHAQ